MKTTATTLKDDARRVIEELPDDVGPNELCAAIDALVLEAKIRRGLEESRRGGPRYTTSEVRRRLGLSE